jgi:hypothetical protein
MEKISRRPADIGGGAAAVVSLWLLVTNWGPIAAGHPSYLVFYVGLIVVGVSTVVWTILRPDRPYRRWLSIVGAVVFVAFTIVAFWLKPFGATDIALDAMDGSATVSVTQDWSRILMEPIGSDPSAGLIFYPGARVDARAYANVLTPIVEAGYRVVIVKPPLGIAFFSTSYASNWVNDDTELSRWVVGGHSLGGVVASSSEDNYGEIVGLVLYASFPSSDISDRSGLTVSSIYGTNDGLAEPERIRASASDLPPTAVLVPIDGAVHSDFGDYGLQPGDGQPDITRTEAQSQITEATLTLMSRIAADS